MPLLEFTCGSCSHQFEELVSRGETPACPECGATRLEKLVSTFGVGSGAPDPAPMPMPPCGSCGDPRGPGACSMN